MKSTTQQILSFLESENFSKLFLIKEKSISFGWGDGEYQEMTLDEAILELESVSNLLQTAINDKNNLFENIYTFHDRSTILSIFQNLDSSITNIKNGSNQIMNLTQNIQQLKSQTRKFDLENRIKGYPNYEEKLKQVSYLKQKYEKLIKNLNEAEKLKNQSEELLSSISKKDEQASEYLNSVSDSRNKLESVEKDIISRHENIKTLNSNIVQYEAETKQNKESILGFFKQTNEYEIKIKNGLETINESIKISDEEMQTVIEKNNEDTTKIISENQKLQKVIYDILGKAIGTNLYKAFSKKSNWMLWQSIFWFALLSASIWFLSDSGKFIFENLKPFFESGQIKDLTLTFYLRLTLIFPSIYAVYFSASEFKNTSKLKEEYDFKSSVSVTLEHFRDLVEKSEIDKDKQFLIDSIEKIFESPTEKVFGKKMNEKDLNSKAKDIVSDVADIANKILPKV